MLKKKHGDNDDSKQSSSLSWLSQKEEIKKKCRYFETKQSEKNVYPKRRLTKWDISERGVDCLIQMCKLMILIIWTHTGRCILSFSFLLAHILLFSSTTIHDLSELIREHWFNIVAASWLLNWITNKLTWKIYWQIFGSNFGYCDFFAADLWIGYNERVSTFIFLSFKTLIKWEDKI